MIVPLSIFTFSHYGDVVARGSIVFTKKIDLLILLDLHVLKVRIQKKWFLGVEMSVCLSVRINGYLGNYLTDLDHIWECHIRENSSIGGPHTKSNANF